MPNVILEAASTFIFLAGFIIGLGAVTVIDLHGFLGRKSLYWTQATVRTHKVTKPLIWIGIGLAVLGGAGYYYVNGFDDFAMWHAIIAVLLILNGFFLSFKVSPHLLKMEKEGKIKLLSKKWQRDITASFIISFVGWWWSLVLLIWHLLFIR